MWKFFEHQTGQPIRNPIENEFFTDDADERTAKHLIREAIQNSLDARVDETATVQFTFGSLTQAANQFLTDDLERHLRAPDNGLINPPEFRSRGRFLAIEDFGTSGLTGDFKRMTDAKSEQTDPSVEDRFYYFWRNVGRNEKGQGAMGTWGLGKSVLPAASKLNTFFGITVRSDDDRQLLLGRTILKSHLLDGVQYDPDGFFADWVGTSPLPVHDCKTVDAFKAAFNLERKHDQPGLSVVIPHVVDEFTEDMLRREVIEHYFYPILAGELVVMIQRYPETPPETILDRNELFRISQSDELQGDDPELAETIYLAEWATSARRKPLTLIRPPDSGSRSDWRNAEWADASPDQVREAIEEGAPFGVEVEVPVEELDDAPTRCRASVYGIRSNRRGPSRMRSYFTRRGVNVTDACDRNPNGFVFLVVVDDPTLADMVGAAENPSHSNLKSRDKLKERYVHGSGTLIIFLTRAPRGIAYAIDESETGPDKGLLSDVFWRPKGNGGDVVKPKPDPDDEGEEVDPPVVIIEPTPVPALIVRRSESGFSVNLNPLSEAVLDKILVKVAYARVGFRGRFSELNRRHSKWDFDFNDLESSGLTVDYSGCDIDAEHSNAFRLSDLQPGFRFELSGFDIERRDIVIRTSYTKSEVK